MKAGVGSNNDLPFQNQSNQTRIDVIDSPVGAEYKLEKDILCEIKL
jgi:hypothetical protein